MISIHAPTRGATILQTSSRRSSRYFNPRSYKRRDAHCSKSSCWRIYFNPRSYKRSDVHFLCDSHVNHVISIHAPTRGATRCKSLFHVLEQFQSTLLQEERRLPERLYRCFSYFNPRSYKRSDMLTFATTNDARKISIHAPTRGATAKMHNNPYTYL